MRKREYIAPRIEVLEFESMNILSASTKVYNELGDEEEYVKRESSWDHVDEEHSDPWKDEW